MHPRTNVTSFAKGWTDPTLRPFSSLAGSLGMVPWGWEREEDGEKNITFCHLWPQREKVVIFNFLLELQF